MHKNGSGVGDLQGIPDWEIATCSRGRKSGIGKVQSWCVVLMVLAGSGVESSYFIEEAVERVTRWVCHR